MKWTDSIKNAFKGMGYSISRFPLTVLFLIVVAVLNAMMIENADFDFTRLIFTFVFGAMLSVVGQMIYERFYVNSNIRYLMMGVAGLLTLIYYFIVGPQVEYNIMITTKTFVALFALLIAFIWIPSINNEAVPFHRSFLSTVKAFFTAFLFTLVLSLGISAIYGAINTLLFEVDSDVLGHLINIVVSLFAPIYFLSMTPLYPGAKEEQLSTDTRLQEQALLVDQFTVPRFLEVLISYIIIPLVVIYTLIIVIYVILNISGDFWTNNLLEPLLVSYAVIVIIVLILSYNLDNRFAIQFRQIFPKILIPIVIFQTIASFLKIGEMGITHGRYYVIMFGVFATITGIIFSFMKPKYHGYIAVAILVLTTISIVPPIDAFTFSKNSQIDFLEEKVTENNLLVNGEIVPNSQVPVEDRIAITNAITYINDMGYNEEVPYLPEKFNAYNDFDKVFGFSLTYSSEGMKDMVNEFAYLDSVSGYAVDVLNYDVMIAVNVVVDGNSEENPFETVSFEADGAIYQLEGERVDNYYRLTVTDASETELITFNTEVLFDEIFGGETGSEIIDKNLTVEDAQFTEENEQVALMVFVKSLDRSENYNYSEIYVFVEIK